MGNLLPKECSMSAACQITKPLFKRILMKHIITWATLVVMFLLGTKTAIAQNSLKNKILAIEQLRFEKMMGRDTAALRDLLSDQLVYIHSNGLTENKTAHLSAIGSSKIIYQHMERKSSEIRVVKNLAFNRGEVHVKGALNGNPFEVQLLYTAVYQKHTGKWQLLHWQSTRRS